MNKADKEKLEALLHLADFSATRFDERRNHSWKIALGFWGSIAGSVALFTYPSGASDYSEHHPVIPICVLLVIGFAAFLLHSFWLKKVFEADKRDKILAFDARNQVMELLSMPVKENDIKSRIWYEDWSVQFQILTTAFLILLVILFYTLLTNQITFS